MNTIRCPFSYAQLACQNTTNIIKYLFFMDGFQSRVLQNKWKYSFFFSLSLPLSSDQPPPIGTPATVGSVSERLRIEWQIAVASHSTALIRSHLNSKSIRNILLQFSAFSFFLLLQFTHSHRVVLRIYMLCMQTKARPRLIAVGQPEN